MSEGAHALAAMLVAGLAAIVARARLVPSDLEQRAAARGAIVVATWLTTTAIAAQVARGVGVDDAWPPLDAVFTASLGYAACSMAARPAARKIGGPATAVVFAAAACGLAAWLGVASSGVAAVCVAASVALAAFVDRAMRQGTQHAARAAVHGATLALVVGALFPMAGLHALGRRAADLAPSPGSLAAGGVLAALAIALGVAASRELVKGGGTPDPLDAPLALTTTGVYARLRHPLVVAESLFVIAVAVAARDTLLGAYAALFAATLAGPARVLEEIALSARHGDRARRYAEEVPAFVPRRTRSTPLR